MSAFAFLHTPVLTPDGLVEDGALLYRAGRILAAGPTQNVQLPEQVTVLDAKGCWLAPGYIDLQLNGGFGLDFTENPATIWEVAAQLPRYGVTAFLPTIITSPLERVESALEVWRQGPPAGWHGAAAPGLHLEGPMLNPSKKGAHNPHYLKTPNMEIIDGWTKENGVRLVTLAPELPGALEVIQALHAAGVVVSAGHSLASYAEAEAGFAAGIRKGTHLFNAMPTLDHRQPGLTGALLHNPNVVAGIIPDGVHAHPAMVALAWQAKGRAGLLTVTDSMAAMGMPPGQYRLGDYDVTVDAVSARLSSGTLAGSIVTMDAAVRNLSSYTGCSLADAVFSATQTPADLLGLTEQGRLQAGAAADFILLSPQGQVYATYIAGQKVYTCEESL